MMTVSPALGSSPSITLIGKTMSFPLTWGLLLRVTTASVTSPLASHDRNGCIGRIVCKGVFPLRDQFHERISVHVAGGSHRAIAEKDDIRICLFERQSAAIENHGLGVLDEQHVAGFILRKGG